MATEISVIGIPLVVLMVLCVFLRIIDRDFKNPFG